MVPGLIMMQKVVGFKPIVFYTTLAEYYLGSFYPPAMKVTLFLFLLTAIADMFLLYQFFPLLLLHRVIVNGISSGS